MIGTPVLGEGRNRQRRRGQTSFGGRATKRAPLLQQLGHRAVAMRYLNECIISLVQSSSYHHLSPNNLNERKGADATSLFLELTLAPAASSITSSLPRKDNSARGVFPCRVTQITTWTVSFNLALFLHRRGVPYAGVATPLLTLSRHKHTPLPGRISAAAESGPLTKSAAQCDVGDADQ
eukprot:CAMPEP_0175836572 /NCGR_PEP_ID=MMETSP0107_2-20121207/17215_1 /TAXON_ID=195067 ORGANISM="Goniomonas pacifica, Strain CCMP1869" /NCGR_SAMPLE_ID=MMETSP0107_2 /ASSEMBLY_ACC=CAM_ASM_000203 /LENGTH=178 /DNA_ID=CAMNT_0017149977 /DNA_START=352 /DNA_END=889 /DNA_ORIENTATION=-